MDGRITYADGYAFILVSVFLVHRGEKEMGSYASVYYMICVDGTTGDRNSIYD